jgi:hypothetical protein
MLKFYGGSQNGLELPLSLVRASFLSVDEQELYIADQGVAVLIDPDEHICTIRLRFYSEGGYSVTDDHSFVLKGTYNRIQTFLDDEIKRLEFTGTIILEPLI